MAFSSLTPPDFAQCNEPVSDILSFFPQVKEAKTGQKDEHISPEQIIARYRGVCSSSSVQTLSKMDFNKIDYDLIETVLVHIVDSAPKSRGSILVFLPGTQKNLNNSLVHGQVYLTLI